MMITANVIGVLCQQIHPEASNQVEAVDLERSDLYKRIQLKLKNNMPAVYDIELYFFLESVYQHLIPQTVQEAILKN